MTEINKINFSVNNVNSQEKKEVKADNKPSTDEGLKKSTKLMIGATALAAVTIGGVILHKGNAARKAAKLAKDLKFERKKMQSLFDGRASEEEITAKLEEIDKLPPAEQKKAYKAMGPVYKNIDGLKLVQEFGEDEVILRRGMKELPQDVKKEMADGNWIKAGELYETHVQALPNTFKAKNIGATVEESISNVFGAESKVKPHTYDLSKEGEEIISKRCFGGYYDVIVTKDGILYEPPKNLGLVRASSGGNLRQNAKYTQIGDKATIVHGVDKDGKYVTILDMKDPQTDSAGNNLRINLGLISNGKTPTPAQQDLLSLAEHPEKFDESLIDKLTFKTHVETAGAENMDYDLALSVIQSMAKG